MKIPEDSVRYGAFWLAVLTVTAGVWATYTALLKPLPQLLGILPWVNWGAIGEEPAWLVVRMILVILLWWRAIKVFVLHGAPIPIGTVAEGLEHDGRSGRPVWQIWIGNEDAFSDNYQGCFWYAAIFRAHPSSDKLMRSRLVLLILALPFGYMFLVQESRTFIRKESHKGRAEMYRRVADRHSKSQDRTSPDTYRTDVAKSLKKVAQLLEADRIVNVDELKWTFISSGGGWVKDHFGNRAGFSKHGDGKYIVDGLGLDGQDTKEAECVNDLKAIVQAHFESTWSGRKGRAA